MQEKELRKTRFVCVANAGFISGLESNRCACVQDKGVGGGECAGVERKRAGQEER
jgi:hypothetical protein